MSSVVTIYVKECDKSQARPERTHPNQENPERVCASVRDIQPCRQDPGDTRLIWQNLVYLSLLLEGNF